MLSVRNVTKKYGMNTVLDDVSLEAASGQIVLIVGDCGAGKSVLLDCIAGTSAFDGSITVGGIGCRSFQARRNVGYVRDPLSPFSDGKPDMRLSADDHIAFVRRAYALDDEGMKYISSLLESFGLNDMRSRRLCELPSCKRRLFEIVMALAIRPGLLLLDRPELGLDDASMAEFEACLLALKHRGTAVVIAVSEYTEIGGIWDAAYELSEGRIVNTVSAADAVPVDADIHTPMTEVPEVKPADIPQTDAKPSDTAAADNPPASEPAPANPMPDSTAADTADTAAVTDASFKDNSVNETPSAVEPDSTASDAADDGSDADTGDGSTKAPSEAANAVTDAPDNGNTGAEDVL